MAHGGEFAPIARRTLWHLKPLMLEGLPVPFPAGTKGQAVKFYQFDIEPLNETDVREEIIAPMLSDLGYGTGTVHNIQREKPVRYRMQLGRPSKNDPRIDGKADYICTVNNRISWVIEAKRGDQMLDLADVRQAWSYANHPSIAAVLFLLTNGSVFELYQTNAGIDAAPVLRFTYEQLVAEPWLLPNNLSPEVLDRNHPPALIDIGEPLAAGLRSSARIASGTFDVLETLPPIPYMAQLTMSVTGGRIERLPGGNLAAYVAAKVHYKPHQALLETLGMDRFELASDDRTLSTDPASPTVFEGVSEFRLRPGTEFFDITTGQFNYVIEDTFCVVETVVEASVLEGEAKGVYRCRAEYRTDTTHILMSSGTFELQLS